jgi:hypothetical protein
LCRFGRNKSRTWISKEDDWDWEEDSKGEDVEMGLIMTTPTNQRSSSRDGNASSVSSSSMSQKTFPTNNTGRSMSSSVKRRNSVPTKSHGMVSNSNEKEEYQEVSRIQTITGKGELLVLFYVSKTSIQRLYILCVIESIGLTDSTNRIASLYGISKSQ